MLYKDEQGGSRWKWDPASQTRSGGMHGSEKDKLDCMSYCSMNNGRTPEQTKTKQEVEPDNKIH